MDLNKLIARVKGILLTPKTEWPVIAGEPATVADLYKGYILILAAIPAVFGFLQMSVIGISLPFAGHMRFGVGAGLSSVVLTYVLTLVSVFVVALIIEALAPTFGGQKDRVQAFKCVTYAYTASWVAAIGQIVPGVGWLIMIAGAIYGIYLMYLGLPHTMKSPPDKAAGYTAVVIIIAIILNFVVAAIVGGVVGVGAGSWMNGGSSFSSSSNSSSNSGDVQFDKDSPLGKLEQWSKNLEEAGGKMEAAQKSGDADAQGDALKQMMGAALGSGQVEALAPDRLKPFVPESLGGMKRSSFSVERNHAMGIQISTATATYSNDAGRSVDLEITDTGTAKGMLALAGWSGMQGESVTDHGYDKTYQKDGRMIHESWDSGSSRGEYSIILGERFTVKVDGRADGIDQLKAAVSELNLTGLEALKEEGVAKN